MRTDNVGPKVSVTLPLIATESEDDKTALPALDVIKSLRGVLLGAEEYGTGWKQIQTLRRSLGNLSIFIMNYV